MLKKWDELPNYMKTDAVRSYYDVLKRKKISLFLKRLFDVLGALIMLILFSPLIIILSIAIVRDSKGGVFYRQERITQYGKKFYIHKFRTMVKNAEQKGSQLTLKNDKRVTKIGKILRKYRLDELPQLIDILCGNMSFVGSRPEVSKYVKKYQPEMFATLLMPAGVTSEASICFKNEEKFLENIENIDDLYINEVLPKKMEINLQSLAKFNLFYELLTMIKTVLAVIKNDENIVKCKKETNGIIEDKLL